MKKSSFGVWTPITKSFCIYWLLFLLNEIPKFMAPTSTPINPASAVLFYSTEFLHCHNKLLIKSTFIAGSCRCFTLEFQNMQKYVFARRVDEKSRNDIDMCFEYIQI